MPPDDYDDVDTEEEDFHEAPEAGPMSRYEEIVFCPKCDEYMPYMVEGVLVRRRCPSCGKLFEGGVEVDPGGSPVTVTKASKSARKSGGSTKKAPRPAKKSPPETEETCAAITKSGTPCSNRPRRGSKYCSSHKGWRPPRKR